MARKLLASAALWRATLDLAAKVREVPLGSNRGPRVEQIQKAGGCGPGDPWCCCAVVCWYQEGASALGIHSPLPITGYCPTLVEWGRHYGRLKPATEAKPGDPVAFWHSDMGRYAHFGICRENRGDGTLVTIEGNTSNTGSREGIGVFQSVRQVSGTRHVCLDMQNISVEVAG